MGKIYIQLDDVRVEVPEEGVLVLGRTGNGADLEIDDKRASRKHAMVQKSNGEVFIKDLKSTNGIWVNAKRIAQDIWIQIGPNDSIAIASQMLKLVIEEDTGAIVETLSRIPEKKELFTGVEGFKQQILQKGVLEIGRLSSNDLVFDDLTVSRHHARLSYENDMFWIQDLGSVNKTYVNGNEIKTKTKLTDNDVVTISFYAIDLVEGPRDLRTVRNAISAVTIEKKYPNNKIGLQSLSLNVPNSTFVALMGPSGCGKSTLLKCLNGDNPATSGEVFIHGLPLLENFNLIKKKIGYVPQDDIIHKELTVYKTLYYAAKLRLPDDTSKEEIDRRISTVICDLNLDQDKERDIRDVKVGSLSGGQRKRISIAVELLTQPTILFLDEPTSPLDPETIDNFLKSLQKLAHSGTTIIMVTHKPEDLNYVDQVIFLGVQGHLVYKGPADRLTSEFQVENIVEVYSKMSDPQLVKKYYRLPSGPGYQKNKFTEVKRDKADSFWLQLYWLVSRYFNVKLNDRGNLVLLLAQPIIIAGLVCLVFKEFRVGVLFLMAISAIWFGVSNAAKEIVGELSIYKRERMFNLHINTYIISKWVVLSLIALMQTLVFVSIIYLNFKNSPPEGFEEVYLRPYWKSIGFMFYISFSASLIGLWLSAALNSTEKVMTVVPIALMPQIMLAGVMTKINNTLVELLSFLTLGRWGTEGFSRLQDQSSPQMETNNESVQSVLTSIPMPAPEQGTMEMSSSAMDVLDLYNQNLIDDGTLIGASFDSLGANIVAIALLNVLFYGLIYFALRKKDSI